MAGILPIPIGRTSDLLVSSRLRQQLQFDQLSLLQIQSQVSTGRRVITPSEDAPAATRGMTLQRLLEQKSQVRINLETSRSYLAATENALGSTSTILAEVRGEALAVADSTRSDSDRRAAAQTVDAAISQLLDAANHKFRGRYLFAGTNTSVRPFQQEGASISYHGNEGQLRSYSDIDLLFDTNRTGNEVFGAISAEVRGSVDLNPVLTASTKLADLHGGTGIRVGSFVISDGQSNSTVDISGVESVGDLVNRIEANPPGGNQVTVRITPTGLEIKLKNSGNLTIRELGSGTTANELGILSPVGVGNNALVGKDLNPRAQLTTRLENVIGVPARTVIESPGDNNNVVLTANFRGAEYNGYRIQYVDDQALQAGPGLTPGNEVVHLGTETSLHARASLALQGADNDLLLTAVNPGTALNNVTIRFEAVNGLGNTANAVYDSGAKTLTLQIDDAGATQVGTLVSEIESTGLFTVTPDASAGEAYDPAGSVSAANAVLTTGSTSNSGGDSQTIFVHIASGGTTAAQVVNALNNDPTVGALFTAAVDSKELLSNALPGASAVALSATAVTSLGAGEEFARESGIQITNGGQTYVIDISSAETIEDLLNLLNGSPANVVAQLKADGTGFDIRSRLSGVDFSIGENGGTTATQLGVRSFHAGTRLEDLNHGHGVHAIEGTDFTIRRSDGSELAIDLSGAVTIGDVLSRINDHPDNQEAATKVVAQLAAVGNGIEIVEDNPGGDAALTIVRNPASEGAWDLGLIPSGSEEAQASHLATQATAAINNGVPNTAFTITALDEGTARNGIEIIYEDSLSGNTANVSFNSAARQLTIQIDPTQTTANTVIQAINEQGLFTAALNAASDPTNNGSGLAANGLGGLPAVVGETAGGTAASLVTADTNPLETRSAFNTLIRLRDALLANDFREIQRSVASLDEDLDRVNFVRADLGAKERSLDTLTQRLDSEEVELRATLSLEIEVDLVEAISELTARQASAEASLRVMGRLTGLTLLNFL